MDALVTPFHFDGHGVNDATGQRIAKVTVGESWQDREPVGKLLSAAPELRDLLDRLQLRKRHRRWLRSRRDQTAATIVAEILAEERDVPLARIRAEFHARKVRDMAVAKRLHLTRADANWLIGCSRGGRVFDPETMTAEHAQRTLTELRASRARSLAAWERTKKAKS